MTSRSIVIGLALSALVAFCIPYLDLYLKATFMGGQHLPPGAVFILWFLVLVINPILRLLHRRLSLTRTELLTIYCMLLFSTLIPGHGSENVFMSVVMAPYYYANPANKWQSLFGDYIPSWMAPHGEGIVRWFYEALPVGHPTPYGAWIVALLAWGLMTLLAYAMMMFLSVILRTQWVDREKLSFPLVALPMEMTSSSDAPLKAGTFFHSRLMWIGFGSVILVQAIVAMHFYFPSFPALQLKYDFSKVFQEEPLSAFGWVPGQVFPSVIGVSFLLRTEVSLSLWLFYWVGKFELLGAHLCGMKGSTVQTSLGMPAWLGMQPSGGQFAYVLLSVWVARRFLSEFWQRVTGALADGGPDAFKARWTFLGLAGALCGMAAWLIAGGMSGGYAVFMIVFYMLLCIILSKVVCESGLLFVQSYNSPMDFMRLVVGTRNMAPRDLTVGTFFEWSFATDQRSFIMPSYLQSLKIATMAGLDQKRLMLASGGACLVAVVISYFMNLRLIYGFGGLACDNWYIQGAGQGGFKILAQVLQTPTGPSVQGIGGMAAGALVTLLLFWMRQRFAWFPLHPVGWIMMVTYPMNMLWFSIFIAWVLKSVISKYGGHKAVLQANGFFLGMVFGDILIMVCFLIIDTLTQTHGHFLLPG